MNSHYTTLIFIVCTLLAVLALVLIGLRYTQSGLILFFISCPFILFIGIKQQLIKPSKVRKKERLIPKLKDLSQIHIEHNGTKGSISTMDGEFNTIKKCLKNMRYVNKPINASHIYTLTFIDHWQGEWQLTLAQQGDIFQLHKSQYAIGGRGSALFGKLLTKRLPPNTEPTKSD